MLIQFKFPRTFLVVHERCSLGHWHEVDRVELLTRTFSGEATTARALTVPAGAKLEVQLVDEPLDL